MPFVLDVLLQPLFNVKEFRPSPPKTNDARGAGLLPPPPPPASKLDGIPFPLLFVFFLPHLSRLL